MNKTGTYVTYFIDDRYDLKNKCLIFQGNLRNDMLKSEQGEGLPIRRDAQTELS